MMSWSDSSEESPAFQQLIDSIEIADIDVSSMDLWAWPTADINYQHATPSTHVEESVAPNALKNETSSAVVQESLLNSGFPSTSWIQEENTQPAPCQLLPQTCNDISPELQAEFLLDSATDSSLSDPEYPQLQFDFSLDPPAAIDMLDNDIVFSAPNSAASDFFTAPNSAASDYFSAPNPVTSTISVNTQDPPMLYQQHYLQPVASQPGSPTLAFDPMALPHGYHCPPSIAIRVDEYPLHGPSAPMYCFGRTGHYHPQILPQAPTGNSAFLMPPQPHSASAFHQCPAHATSFAPSCNGDVPKFLKKQRTCYAQSPFDAYRPNLSPPYPVTPQSAHAALNPAAIPLQFPPVPQVFDLPIRGRVEQGVEEGDVEMEDAGMGWGAEVEEQGNDGMESAMEEVYQSWDEETGEGGGEYDADAEVVEDEVEDSDSDRDEGEGEEQEQVAKNNQDDKLVYDVDMDLLIDSDSDLNSDSDSDNIQTLLQVVNETQLSDSASDSDSNSDPDSNSDQAAEDTDSIPDSESDSDEELGLGLVLDSDEEDDESSDEDNDDPKDEDYAE